MDKKRRGQVWIETVIYTLIAFVLIGLILSYATPKIQEAQDQAIIQQSVDMMKTIDSTILTIGAAGSQRYLEPTIKKGDLKIDGENNKIIFEIESQSIYSEPGKNINDGSVVILTEEKSGYNLVTLTLDYQGVYNLQFGGADSPKKISKASTAYKLTILNKGVGTDGKIILDFSLG
jgi:type II secretory pathway pseudopilin PulG